jgi:putative DNA-binding protein
MSVGKKIKEIRIEKGISRPVFCGDEQELTIRQL